MNNDINYAAHGFKTDFGTTVRHAAIHVTIVVGKAPSTERYGVYVSHGHPGGQFWRNSPPLVRCTTIEEALGKAETLYGIVGSAKFAMIVDALGIWPASAYVSQ